jgi:hypothetical protein
VLTINLEVIGTRDATIAGVDLLLHDEIFSADGTAKREPRDEDNREVAELLALGRALESLSNKLLKRANGLIKHQDDMRAYKELQKKRKPPTAKKQRELEVKRVQGRKVVKETRCFS